MRRKFVSARMTWAISFPAKGLCPQEEANYIPSVLPGFVRIKAGVFGNFK
jgi:hypothetical protein